MSVGLPSLTVACGVRAALRGIGKRPDNSMQRTALCSAADAQTLNVWFFNR